MSKKLAKSVLAWWSEHDDEYIYDSEPEFVKIAMEELKLAKSVLAWWSEHKYDTHGEFDEYNVFSSEPEFVKIAMEELK